MNESTRLTSMFVCLYECLHLNTCIGIRREAPVFWGFFCKCCLMFIFIYILYIFPLASEERFLSFVAVPSGANGGNLEAGHNVYTSQLYFASTVSSPLVILYSLNKHVKSMYNQWHIKIKRLISMIELHILRIVELRRWTTMVYLFCTQMLIWIYFFLCRF